MAQVGLLVADEDVGGGDVADHAGDARPGRRGQHVGNKDAHELLFGVGTPLAGLVAVGESGAFHKAAGIELHLVGQKRRVGDETTVVGNVGGGVGAEQVHHEVHVAFEAEPPQEGHGVGDARGRDGAAVGGEKVVGEALDADLHLGAAECAQAAAGIGGDEVGARFHHQPDDALRCRFVGAMQGEKGVPGAALQRLTLNAFP